MSPEPTDVITSIIYIYIYIYMCVCVCVCVYVHVYVPYNLNPYAHMYRTAGMACVVICAALTLQEKLCRGFLAFAEAIRSIKDAGLTILSTVKLSYNVGKHDIGTVIPRKILRTCKLVVGRVAQSV